MKQWQILRKNRLVVASLYSMILVVVMFIGFESLAQDDGMSDEQKQQFMKGAFERLMHAEHGAIRLRGEVVDDQGQRLNGVAIDLEKGRLTNFGEASETDEEKLMVNGTFDLSVTGYTSVRATFSKQGYYSRFIEFAISLADEIGWRVFTGETVSPQTLTKEGLRIVLEKQGNVTRLQTYGGFLEYRADGSGKVVNFDKSPVGRKALQTVQNVHNAGQLPTNCAYVVAQSAAGGGIAAVQVTRPYGQNNVDTFPQQVTLTLNDPTGGFIPFTPAVRKNTYHQMKIAPEAGYQRQLVLTADYFAQVKAALTESKDDNLHFFFRTGGKYGKGNIGDVVLDKTGADVLLGVAFRIQPDGSRNLETDEGLGEDFTPAAKDTTPPTITVFGDNPATVECHNGYTDAGATATDDKDGDLTSSITVSNTVNTAVVGTYMVGYSVSDAAGNRATAVRTVNVVDTTPPVIHCPGDLTVGCSTNLETPVSFSVTATDSCDLQPFISSSPASGSGLKVGATNVVCRAVDAAGNTNTCTFAVTRAALGFTGFLAPISGADVTGGDFAHPLRAFKLKSTVPVRFTASCEGGAVTAGVHTLQVIKYSDETTAADPIDATPTDAATTGNQFRLTDGEWHFNLDSKATGMTAGTWLLRATLSDGSAHTVWIALK
jgi:hypothetical protein